MWFSLECFVRRGKGGRDDVGPSFQVSAMMLSIRADEMPLDSLLKEITASRRRTG